MAIDPAPKLLAALVQRDVRVFGVSGQVVGGCQSRDTAAEDGDPARRRVLGRRRVRPQTGLGSSERSGAHRIDGPEAVVAAGG